MGGQQPFDMEKIKMKRLVLIAVLLLSAGVSAQADTSVYISKTPRSDADLQAAGPLLQQAQGNAGLEKQMTGR